MNPALDRFCSRTKDVLQTGRPLPEQLTQIAGMLSDLLADRAFVAETFSDDMPVGKREIHHDPSTDFRVLAHVQEAGRGGSPHTHGTSWAIYGNARGYTEMTEWRRVNPEGDDHAELVQTDKYRLNAGETRAYAPGVIHSTAHPEKAWVIRVTGTDLDALPRYRFSKRRDKILEGVA